jgi:hypothetical protein
MDDTVFTDEQTPFSRDDAHEIFKQFASHYDAPAYVRRARQVEDAFEQLLARCRAQRDEWLNMVRIRLGLLRMQAGDWMALRPWLENDDQLELLERLHSDLAPQPRLRVEATRSERLLRRALAELVQSIARFNRRWLEFLPSVDLAPVNALRDGYNRYYLLEKECAIRSPRLARQGFRRLEAVTTADLAQLLPVLPVPALARAAGS